MSSFSADDYRFMSLAIELAKRGLCTQPQSNEVKDLMKMFDILYRLVQASEEG